MEQCAVRMRQWDENGKQVVDEGVMHDGALCQHCYLVIWFHDKCIFYAHDCCIICWVHSSKTAKPYAKGEGQSLMVADFVLANYGFLSSTEGCGSVRVELKPGKNCDGYFSNDELLTQVQLAIDLVCTHFPNDDHIFIFDNARSHSK